MDITVERKVTERVQLSATMTVEEWTALRKALYNLAWSPSRSDADRKIAHLFLDQTTAARVTAPTDQSTTNQSTTNQSTTDRPVSYLGRVESFTTDRPTTDQSQHRCDCIDPADV